MALLFGGGGRGSGPRLAERTATVAGVQAAAQGGITLEHLLIGGLVLLSSGLRGSKPGESANAQSPAPEKTRMTAPEATKAAKDLGYDKTNFKSHGQPVFKQGNKYITPDVDAHSGGTWKMADSVENLGSKSTRTGTFDANLVKIGD